MSLQSVLIGLMILFVVFWIVSGCYFYSKVRGILKKYQIINEIDVPTKYQCFMRTDYSKWNRKKMLIGSFLKSPRNALCIGGLMITNFLAVFPSKFLNAISGKWRLGYKFYCFMSYWVAGLQIKLSTITVVNQKIPELNDPIIICNHVCWFDIVYMIQNVYPFSFISKQAVSRWPIAGQITKFSQGIFIERESEANRHDVMNKIKERVQKFNNREDNYDVYPIGIFPQGTNSNGKSILRFKIGAFINKTPITMVCLHYQCDNFQMGMDEITQYEHVMLSLCQSFKVSAKFIKMQSTEQQTPEQYMERCRIKMSETLNYPCYDSGYKEYQQYNQIIKSNKFNKKHQ